MHVNTIFMKRTILQFIEWHYFTLFAKLMFNPVEDSYILTAASDMGHIPGRLLETVLYTCKVVRVGKHIIS